MSHKNCCCRHSHRRHRCQTVDAPGLAGGPFVCSKHWNQGRSPWCCPIGRTKRMMNEATFCTSCGGLYDDSQSVPTISSPGRCDLMCHASHHSISACDLTFTVNCPAKGPETIIMIRVVRGTARMQAEGLDFCFKKLSVTTEIGIEHDTRLCDVRVCAGFGRVWI